MSDKSGGKKETYANTEAKFVAICMLVLTGCWLMWDYLSYAVVLPISVMNWSILKVDGLISGLDRNGESALNLFESIILGHLGMPPDIEWERFMEIRSWVGERTRFLLAIFLIACAAFTFKYRKVESFERRFTLTGRKKHNNLALYQATKWRNASVSANFDAAGRNRNIKPALNPYDWLKVNDVAYEKGRLDNEAIEAVLSEQLGDTWSGLENASLWVQAVVVLCTLHLTKHEFAFEERSKIAHSWRGKMDGTRVTKALVEEYLRDDSITGEIEYATRHHAYEYTVVIAMLGKAREASGVLPSSDFLWVRMQDRRLWYVINNVGRQVYNLEAIAPFAHYFCEIINEKPMVEPQLDGIAHNIEEYLKSHGVYSLAGYFQSKDSEP